MTSEAAFQEAVSRHRLGQAAEAVAAYRAVLAEAPDHAKAHHNLGALLIDAGQVEDGAVHLKRALEASPETAEFWFAYVAALIRAGRPAEAREWLDTGLQRGLAGPNAESLDASLDALCPRTAELQHVAERLSAGAYAEAEAAAAALTRRFPEQAFGWKALGAVLSRQDRLEASAEATRRAALLAPGDGEAWTNLGAVLHALARFDEAHGAYLQALALDPNRADLNYSMALTLSAANRPAEAETCLRTALATDPNSLQHLILMGVVLGQLRRWAEAEAVLKRAAELHPEVPEPQLGLGVLRAQLGDFKAAVQHYRKALALGGDSIEARNNLALALYHLNRLTEAEQVLRGVIVSRPDYVEAHLNLGNLLKDEGRLEETRALYDRAIELDPAAPRYRSNRLLLDNYIPGADRAAGLEAAKRYGALCAARAGPIMTAPCPRSPREHLRVGLVSSDFRDHPVGYFLESVLGALDPARIELAAYSNTEEVTPLTHRIIPRFRTWRVISDLTDEEAARRIHDDGIDILIDLSGHTAEDRMPVFAFKPAPVQASWLGYSNTTGVAQIDYLIGDRHVARAADQPFFTETLWALPDSYLCFTPPPLQIEVGPAPCLSGASFTFGCFNNPAKLNDRVVALWGRIMKASPAARLLLKSPRFADADFAGRTLGRFMSVGAAEGQVQLEGGSDRAGYLEAYNRVDIVLDPFPFPGGTTTVEGLWMGTPLVTLEGDRFLARAGAGFCRNVGLGDWVAADEDGYVDIALAKADDRQALAALRTRLREDFLASPLCDAARFARNFEAALHGMWEGRRPPPLS